MANKRRIQLSNGLGSVFVTEQGLLFSSQHVLDQVTDLCATKKFRDILGPDLLALGWYVNTREYMKLNREIAEGLSDETSHDSVLVRFHNKDYYVKYSDLLNKAVVKVFAYEDEALEKQARINGHTLMFNKKGMEDKMKNSIKMDSPMPGAAKTENSNGMLGLGSSPEQLEWDRQTDREKWEKQQMKQVKIQGKTYQSKPAPNRPEIEKGEAGIIDEWIVMKDGKTIGKLVKWIKQSDGTEYGFFYHQNDPIYLKASDVEFIGEGMKMTTEQKLRKYIREQVIKTLEDSPYGKPDPQFYLNPDGDMTEQEGEAPSKEELEAKQKAAQEKAKKDAYKRFFSQALAKFGYSGVSSIPDEKKKSFFDFVDKNWTSKQEAEQGPKGVKGTTKKVDETVERVKVDGKMYDANVFFDDDAANAFMETHPGWGVITANGQEGTKNYKVYVAKNADTGQKDWEDPAGKGKWTDPAGGIHDDDEDDPASMYVETSGTGGVAGYETPMAFTGQPGKVSKKQKQISNQLGYKLVDDETDEGVAQYLNEDMHEVQIKNELYSEILGILQANFPGTPDNKFEYIATAIIEMLDEKNLLETLLKEDDYPQWQGKYDKMYKTILSVFNNYRNGVLQNEYEDAANEILIAFNEENLLETLLKEGLDSYYFKDENLTSEQKLGLAMRQVRNNLYEVEKVVSRTIKMKNEDNVDSSKVGKRTYQALKRINEKVIRLMIALQELK